MATILPLCERRLFSHAKSIFDFVTEHGSQPRSFLHISSTVNFMITATKEVGQRPVISRQNDSFWSRAEPLLKAKIRQSHSQPATFHWPSIEWRPLNKSLNIVTTILVAKEWRLECRETRFAILEVRQKVRRCFLVTFTRVLNWTLAQSHFYYLSRGSYAEVSTHWS